MSPQQSAIARSQPAWFKNWFDTAFYHQLYGHRDETEAAAFIDALLDELQPRPHSRMMDLGCGAGRHAKYLASKGFNVTGTDLSLSSILTAKRSETAGLHFYQHDMRLPFGTNRYDYVFNFFTSFGYFKTEEENHQVIANIGTALKPGGTVVIDYLNVDYSTSRLVFEEEKEIDGIVYQITRWTDEKHFFKQIQIRDRSQNTFLFREQVARLYMEDFEYLFEQNGLRLQAVYGDYRLVEFKKATSPRLILTAQKVC